MSGFLAGAVMMTFFAPGCEVLGRAVAVREPARALEDDVDAQVDFHGSSAGSFTESTLKVSPSTVMVSPAAETGTVEVAEHRVVLQQVRQRLGAR